MDGVLQGRYLNLRRISERIDGAFHIKRDDRNSSDVRARALWRKRISGKIGRSRGAAYGATIIYLDKSNK